MTRPAALAAVALALAGCGDALVASDYAGTPKLHIGGHTDGSSPAIDLDNPLVRASIFWSPTGVLDISNVSALREQPSNGLTVPFPGAISWNLFDEPADDQLAAGPGGSRYGLGLLLAYEDTNGNGVLDANETLVAVSPVNAVLYAKVALTAAQSPTGVPVPAGFHLVSYPFACGPQPAAPAGPACAVKLGATCVTDADCGADGTCLTESPWPWPGGACAVADPTPRGCHPTGAARFTHPVAAPSATATNPPPTFWVQACGAPADCSRGGPYQCDLSIGGCLPTLEVVLEASADVELVQVCLGPPGAGPPQTGK